ncbi:MAG TPA: hypothetical protein VFG36_04110 [Methanoregula sp.]|nr:hypothetical protein [Methanoregula sp.]
MKREVIRINTILIRLRSDTGRRTGVVVFAITSWRGHAQVYQGLSGHNFRFKGEVR